MKGSVFWIPGTKTLSCSEPSGLRYWPVQVWVPPVLPPDILAAFCAKTEPPDGYTLDKDHPYSSSRQSYAARV